MSISMFIEELKLLKEENKELRKKLEYYQTGTDLCDMESERFRGQDEAWN